MNRRNFLRNLALFAPVAAVKPSYFFAPIGGWHSDVIVNPYHPKPELSQCTMFWYTYNPNTISAEALAAMGEGKDYMWAVDSEYGRTTFYRSA